jgi:hypothetical protein
MAEWLKAHAWKACLGETLTWVRIPLSPPVLLLSDLSAIHTVVHTVKTQPEERYAMFSAVSLLSQLIVPGPARSLALSIFAAPKLAKELPDLPEFCSGPTFATIGRSE